MEYGCAPWPAVKPELADFTWPRPTCSPFRGARTSERGVGIHQIRQLDQPAGPEPGQSWSAWNCSAICRRRTRLCGSGVRSSSSITRIRTSSCSADWRRVRISCTSPKIGIWEEFASEQDEVFEKVRLLIQPPAAALAFCQARVSERWAEHRRSLARHGLHARRDRRSRPPPGGVDHQPSTKPSHDLPRKTRSALRPGLLRALWEELERLPEATRPPCCALNGVC